MAARALELLLLAGPASATRLGHGVKQPALVVQGLCLVEELHVGSCLEMCFHALPTRASVCVYLFQSQVEVWRQFRLQFETPHHGAHSAVCREYVLCCCPAPLSPHTAFERGHEGDVRGLAYGLVDGALRHVKSGPSSRAPWSVLRRASERHPKQESSVSAAP